MKLVLSNWDLAELAEKIANENCDGVVDIPIYEIDDNEFQVVCSFNLRVSYGEREENTGWRYVDTIDFCVTEMCVACNGETIDISVDWDDDLLTKYVKERYDD
jgi:hypothetical protein